MVDWPTVRVGDLVEKRALVINDGYRMRNEELGATGIPFVRGGDIGDGSINTDTIDHIRPEFAERVASKLTRPGDVAFITKGTVGRTGFLRPEQPAVVFAPQVAYWRVLEPEVLDPRFVFYLLRGAEFQNNLDAVKTHGAMAADYVSISLQHQFRLRVPPIQDQRAMARVLGSLDDKIELNRRMNETLEAVARALFKSWFVDFDPVRAKMRGEQPAGMDAATAALFPSRLVQTEHGEVPEGWAFHEIGNAVRVVGGSTPSTERAELWDGEHAWVRPKDLSGLASPVLLRTERTITDQGLATVSSGLLPVGSVLLSSRAPIGYLTVARIPVAINQGFIGMICDRSLTTNYVLRWTESQLDAIKARAGGTTFPEISKGTFRPMLVRVPSRNVLVEFEKVASSFLQRIEANEREAATLTELRDALLPRLLSGELRVPHG